MSIFSPGLLKAKGLTKLIFFPGYPRRLSVVNRWKAKMKHHWTKIPRLPNLFSSTSILNASHVHCILFATSAAAAVVPLEK